MHHIRSIDEFQEGGKLEKFDAATGAAMIRCIYSESVLLKEYELRFLRPDRTITLKNQDGIEVHMVTRLGDIQVKCGTHCELPTSMPNDTWADGNSPAICHFLLLRAHDGPSPYVDDRVDANVSPADAWPQELVEFIPPEPVPLESTGPVPGSGLYFKAYEYNGDSWSWASG